MSRLIINVLNSSYALVAIADTFVLTGFYGPSLLGGNLRSIPGFEDALPFVALTLLGSSIFLLLIFLVKTVRSKIFNKIYMRFCVVLIFIYALIAGIGFGEIFFGYV